MNKIKIHFWLFILGTILTFSSIFVAIQFNFSYWYLPFLIGSWLLFDFIDFKYRKISILSILLKGKWKRVLSVYLTWAFIGLILDVFGVLIGELWFYPSHNRGIHFLYPPLLIYPLGAFSVYELYYAVKGFVTKKFKDKRKINQTKKKKLIAKSLLLISIFSGIIPFIFLLLKQTLFIKELFVILMVLNIFAFDAIQYLLLKKSILFNLLNLNKTEIIALIFSLFLSVLLHEYPNVFAKEWVYQNIPFISIELFGIPVIVATVGWIFLIVNVVSSGNLFLSKKVLNH